MARVTREATAWEYRGSFTEAELSILLEALRYKRTYELHHTSKTNYPASEKLITNLEGALHHG